jgi:hypothetical protein
LQALPGFRNRAIIRDLSILIALGFAAAALTSINASPIRLPGHAILRGALPFIFGLSLAPRVSAGSLMSAAALAFFAAADLLSAHLPPLPAAVGLIALGPTLDLATRRVPLTGSYLYVRFAVAGLAANLASFAARFAWGGASPQGSAGYALGSPLVALTSFALFGVVAGLVCGIVWFRARPRREHD